MASAGGKGRISNELVAASCAAVLAVYAAGYWRTREDARRVDVRTQERRPPRPAPLAAAPAAGALQSPDVAAPSPIPLPASASASASAAPLPQTAATIPDPPPLAEASPTTAASATRTPATPTAAATSLPVKPGPSTVPAAAEPTPTLVATTPAEPTVAATPAAPLATPSGTWRDGTYTGWGTSRHGDIKAQVVIREGRIVDASIASCETRYPCDVIADIIHQPVDRQNPDVDRVTRATESADAYYWGLVEALKEAQVPGTEVAAAAAPR